jgi:hypothetical protein
MFYLSQGLIKNMLYGTSDAEPQTDIVVSQLAQELYNSNLLLLLVQVSTVFLFPPSSGQLTVLI